ncbi:MAG: ATP phosphoribosyltransferase regulatory subunit [Pseudomonadota bacterium]
MPSAWLLPEHIADVLPVQARQIEALRRRLLDRARSYGFELVIPPLLEHLESLLSGTGRELDLRTFKLVDQLSGRMLGVRADTTPQAARIDAHLLNREGVTRLCYCGPVLHTRPDGAASREPLQFGAEIFGHAGLEADLEAAELALDCLQAAGAGTLVIDLADARVLRGVLAGVPLDGAQLEDLAAALADKDVARREALGPAGVPQAVRSALRELPRLYGGVEVLEAARRVLPQRPLVKQALDELAWLESHLKAAFPDLKVGFDLSELSGYAYYSGARFAVYGGASSVALARGGRYDEVGAVFGRNRPAVGFSLDLKALADVVPARPAAAAVLAPWGEDPELRSIVRRLRDAGETVIAALPGQPPQTAAFACDRELVQVAGRWALQARTEPPHAPLAASAPSQSLAAAPSAPA